MLSAKLQPFCLGLNVLIRSEYCMTYMLVFNNPYWVAWTNNFRKHTCVTSIADCFLAWSLRWRHNGRNSVSIHQPHDCLFNCLFRRRSKKTSKLRVTGLCAGNSPGTGEFPAQRASNAENVSIWWRHHVWENYHFWQTLFLEKHLRILHKNVSSNV